MSKVYELACTRSHAVGKPNNTLGKRLNHLERPICTSQLWPFSHPHACVNVNWKQNVTIGYPLGDLMTPRVEHHWG